MNAYSTGGKGYDYVTTTDGHGADSLFTLERSKSLKQSRETEGGTTKFSRVQLEVAALA